MDEIVFKIKKQFLTHKYIVIGELHGVRENVDILLCLLRDFEVKNKQRVAFAFEWPLTIDEETAINQYVTGIINNTDEKLRRALKRLSAQESGVFSDQHYAFLEVVRDFNEKRQSSTIKIIAFDPDITDWNVRDRRMAEHIIKSSVDTDIVMIAVGDLHARKHPFQMEQEGFWYHPLASILPPEQTFSALLRYKSGQFYNFGIKTIQVLSGNEDRGANFFDHISHIQRATPITRYNHPKSNLA